MAIAYPLDLPTAMRFTDTDWSIDTVVGENVSPFTRTSQTFVWPGQRWLFSGQCAPVRHNTDADAIFAFLLALNGREGFFRMHDRTRPTTRGTAAGAWQVGAGAAALSTTLPIQNGAGMFALNDWLQIGNYLYRVIKLVDGTHVDVWPRLRASHAAGTAIVYTEAKGLFKLARNTDVRDIMNTIKHHSFSLQLTEYL